jgi:hypothetical protein
VPLARVPNSYTAPTIQYFTSNRPAVTRTAIP